MSRPLSTLELALLGLLGEGPKSGYEVRQLFRDTALASYSDSPGSIYPALRRLAARRLIRGEARRSGRRQRIYRLTESGEHALRGWLDAPVTDIDVVSSAGVLELKLAFMSTSHARRLRGFLREWAQHAFHWAETLHRQIRSLGGVLPVSGQMAMNLGLEMARARARYLRRVTRGTKRSPSARPP